MESGDLYPSFDKIIISFIAGLDRWQTLCYTDRMDSRILQLNAANRVQKALCRGLGTSGMHFMYARRKSWF
jgi:hypothetical protein